MHATMLLATLAIGLSLGAGSLQSKDARPGVCDREGEKMLGQKPARISGAVQAPKQLRHVSPNYPEWPAGAVGRGMWIGEALIDPTGKVTQVWTLREPELTPPFPAFNAAIVDAIRKWTFEPPLVNGKPVALCMTATVNIHWR